MYFKPKVNSALKVIKHVKDNKGESLFTTEELLFELHMCSSKLEQMLFKLRDLGLVTSKSGRHGGYNLVSSKLYELSFHDLHNAYYPTAKEGFGIFIEFKLTEFME